jgi:hypothetical protein
MSNKNKTLKERKSNKRRIKKAIRFIPLLLNILQFLKKYWWLLNCLIPTLIGPIELEVNVDIRTAYQLSFEITDKKI